MLVDATQTIGRGLFTQADARRTPPHE
jgi:hypothetical protein